VWATFSSLPCFELAISMYFAVSYTTIAVSLLAAVCSTKSQKKQSESMTSSSVKLAKF